MAAKEFVIPLDEKVPGDYYRRFVLDDPGTKVRHEIVVSGESKLRMTWGGDEGTQVSGVVLDWLQGSIEFVRMELQELGGVK